MSHQLSKALSASEKRFKQKGVERQSFVVEI
jgi:hypothetical protein